MSYYQRLREQTKEIFSNTPEVRCPYFNQSVVLNADGLHHLRYSARRERNKPEQVLKFSLVPLALEVIKRSGTIQEYRRIWQAIGTPSAHDQLRPAKEVEYWGLVAIIGPRPTKIRVILRRVGDGKIVFWSVMRYSKSIKSGNQRLAPDGLEDE
jgi:hypothetical protein